MKQPKNKSIDFLINKVQTRHRDFDNIPKFSLLLGAGCSKSSGIPTGWELISTLKKLWFLDNHPKGVNFKKNRYEFDEEFFISNKDLFEQKTLEEELKLKEYILENKNAYLKSIPNYLKTGKSDDQVFQENLENIFNDNLYGFWFNQFSESPRDRQQFIEYLIDKSEPRGAYLLLTHLIASEANLFSNIFTTNFDDLINDSLIRYSTKKPRVYAHNEIAKYINIYSSRPNIIKLHGDFLFENIKNTTDETKSLWENMEVKLSEALNTLDIVIVGYSGGDISIMQALTDLKRKHNFCVFWCNRNYDKLSWRAKAFLEEFDNSYFVEIDSFEYLVYKLYSSVQDSISPIDIVEASKIKQEEFDKYLAQYSDELIKGSELNESEKESIKESFEIILERNSFIDLNNIKDYDKKKEYLGKLRIDGISRVLKNIFSNISWEDAKFLYAEIDKEDFFQKKIEAAPIQHISNALTNLNSVDNIRTKAILENIPDDILKKKFENAKDGDVYSALGELASISPEKIEKIKGTRKLEYNSTELEKLDLRALILKLKTASKDSAISILRSEQPQILDKLTTESIKEVAFFLNNLSDIAEKIASQFYKQIKDETIISRIEKESFNQIGISLNLFTKLDRTKTYKICENLNFEQIVAKTEKLNLASIQNGLREINISNPYLAFQLYDRLKNEFLKTKFEQADLLSISEAASNLLKINRQKTNEVLKELPDDFFQNLINSSDFTYQQFATSIEKLTQIDFTRFSRIVRSSDTELICNKILASINKTGQQIFIHHFPTLTNIDYNITNKIIEGISSEYLYNIVNWEKLELYTVNLPSLKTALDNCSKETEAKQIQDIIDKNKFRFEKYRKQNYKKHLP